MKKNLKKKEELIHVRLEPDELFQSRRDMLSIEMGLLQMVKFLKHYHHLRAEELNKKTELNKKIKELNLNIIKLQKTLPKLQVPKILNKGHEVEESKSEFKHVDMTAPDQSIESQLQEVQDRLKDLG